MIAVTLHWLPKKKKKKKRRSNLDSQFSSITISKKEEKSIISFIKKNYSSSLSRSRKRMEKIFEILSLSLSLFFFSSPLPETIEYFFVELVARASLMKIELAANDKKTDTWAR